MGIIISTITDIIIGIFGVILIGEIVGIIDFGVTILIGIRITITMLGMEVSTTHITRLITAIQDHIVDIITTDIMIDILEIQDMEEEQLPIQLTDEEVQQILEIMV